MSDPSGKKPADTNRQQAPVPGSPEHLKKLDDELRADIDATLNFPFMKGMRKELLQLRSEIGKPATEEEMIELRADRARMLEFTTAYKEWLDAGSPEGQKPTLRKKTPDGNEQSGGGQTR